MGWPFCPQCHSNVKVNTLGEISCDLCPYTSHLSEMIDEIPPITTYSINKPTPIWAKTDQEQELIRKRKDYVLATIEDPCIKCGYPEVGYYIVQLRSVDEGSTVFYECPKCNHHWSTNN